MGGNVGRHRAPKPRRRFRLTLDERTISYLTGWHDRLGRNVGQSEAVEELVGYAIDGGLEKIVEDERIDISDLELMGG